MKFKTVFWVFQGGVHHSKQSIIRSSHFISSSLKDSIRYAAKPRELGMQTDVHLRIPAVPKIMLRCQFAPILQPTSLITHLDRMTISSKLFQPPSPFSYQTPMTPCCPGHPSS
ncbi:hypothetical protein EJB05_28588, partial [Eragrostis curvula]